MQVSELLTWFVTDAIYSGEGARFTEGLEVEEIARRLEVSVDETKRALDELMDAGLIDSYRARVSVGIKDWDLAPPTYSVSREGIARCLRTPDLGALE